MVNPGDPQYIINENGFYYVASMTPEPGSYNAAVVTVSAKGVANGLSEKYNDGFLFGPDTYNPNSTATPPYTETSGLQEAVNHVAPLPARINGKIIIKIIGGGNLNISVPISFPNFDFMLVGDNGTQITANAAMDYMIALNYVGLRFANITFNGNSLATNIFNVIIANSDDDVVYFDNCSILSATENGFYFSGPGGYVVLYHCMLYANGNYGIYSEYPIDNMEVIECNGNGNNFLYVNITSGNFPITITGGGDFGQITASSTDPGTVEISATNTNFNDYGGNQNYIVSLTGVAFLGTNVGFTIYRQNTYFSIGVNTIIDISQIHIGSVYDDDSYIIVGATGSTATGEVVKISGYFTNSASGTTMYSHANYPGYYVVRNYGSIGSSAGTVAIPPISYSTLSIPAPASGTVYQNTNPFDIEIDLPAYATTSGTAGYVTIAKGATSTPTAIGNQYVSGDTSDTSEQIIRLKVPANWYYSFTASGVTFGTASVFAE